MDKEDQVNENQWTELEIQEAFNDVFANMSLQGGPHLDAIIDWASCMFRCDAADLENDDLVLFDLVLNGNGVTLKIREFKILAVLIMQKVMREAKIQVMNKLKEM